MTINVRKHTQIQLDLDAVTIDDVLTSYTGRAHNCRCGCKGTYKCTEARRELNGKRRGYKVDDNEVSDRSVQQTLNRLKFQNGLFPVSISQGLGEELIVDCQIGKRDVTVYLIK